MKKTLLILMSLLFTGCASMKGVAKALKDDRAIVTVRMGTPWGIQSLTRIGWQETNSITISPEGSVTVNK